MKENNFVSLIFIFALFIVSSINCFADNSCKLIKENLPKQFLKFERNTQSNRIIAFYNNSNCSIFVETDDFTPTINIKGELLKNDELYSKSAVENVVYPLRYYIKPKHSNLVRQRDKWQHSLFVIEIPPGKKMLFSVSKKEIKSLDSLLVKFSYQNKPNFGIPYPDLIVSEKILNLKKK